MDSKEAGQEGRVVSYILDIQIEYKIQLWVEVWTIKSHSCRAIRRAMAVTAKSG